MEDPSWWKTFPETKQEVFDIVVKHLLIQNKRSTFFRVEDTDDFVSRKPESGCAYRGYGNLKCAAGILIPDDVYVFGQFENNSWRTLISKNLVPITHSFLIRQLQQLHDNIEPDYWEDELRSLAASEDVQFNVDWIGWLKEELQPLVSQYIDTRLVEPEDWCRLNPNVETEADLHLTAEGTLYSLLNGHCQPDEGDLTYVKLQAIAEKYRCRVSQHYAWSWHFSKLRGFNCG